MSINKFRPHLHVIVEDSKLADIARGFAIENAHRNQFDIRQPAGGWPRAEVQLERQINELDNYSQRIVIVVIDFDNEGEQRRERFLEVVPEHLRERVIVLGPVGKCEQLTSELAIDRESIGRKLARECQEDAWESWNCTQLAHNQPSASGFRQRYIGQFF